MTVRNVVQAEALAWLDANQADPGASVVTSLPDISELPDLDLDGWRAWFIGAVRRIIRWVPDEGVAIFYQSDVRQGGMWIDKGYLVMRGAEEEDAGVLWHKIVCRRAPGTIALGRPSYSHMIAVGKGTARETAKARPGRTPGCRFHAMEPRDGRGRVSCCVHVSSRRNADAGHRRSVLRQGHGARHRQ